MQVDVGIAHDGKEPSLEVGCCPELFAVFERAIDGFLYQVRRNLLVGSKAMAKALQGGSKLYDPVAKFGLRQCSIFLYKVYTKIRI